MYLLIYVSVIKEAEIFFVLFSFLHSQKDKDQRIGREFFLLCGIFKVCQGLDFMGTSNQHQEITLFSKS